MRSDIIIGWEVTYEDIKNLFFEGEPEDGFDENIDKTYILREWTVLRYESKYDGKYEWYISYYNDEWMSVSDMFETIKELEDLKHINTLHEYLRTKGVNPEICKYDNMGVYSVITNFYHD